MPKVYVLCDNSCKYEGMTKEQILTAIMQAVENGEIKDVDTGFITTIKSVGTEKGLSFWFGTEAEFNALSPTPDTSSFIAKVDADGKIYICKDDSVIKKVLDFADIMANVENARRYLGAATTFTKEVTVPVSAWQQDGEIYTAVVEVGGLTDTDTPILDVSLTGVLSADKLCLDAWGCVYMAVATENTLTLYAENKPEDTFTLNVKVVR